MSTLTAAHLPKTTLTLDDIATDGQIELPEDLSALSQMDLLQLKVRLEELIQSIWNQISEYKYGALPPHMMTEQWRRKAQSAGRWHESKLALVKLEFGRRNEEAKRIKEERSAAATDRQQNRDRAIIEAAKMLLPRDTFLAIIELARKNHPEAFEWRQSPPPA